ncbi:MAG TPA: CopG family transcriptional regulator [Rhodocyclaceae bacterium]|nr:CopG family transcriptional regulator [Rhodocyclaceae bacterium]
MVTTTLKLPDELKQRAAEAARRLGVSPHAFMVQAIEQAATAAEQRASFVAAALEAKAQALASGEGYDATEVHAYLKARIADRNATRPKVRRWRD